MLIRELIPGYLEELKILNRSPLTIRNIRGALNAMALFLEHEGITELVQFNRNALHLFQEDLAYRLTAKGKQLSVSTREKYLCSVRALPGISMQRIILPLISARRSRCRSSRNAYQR
ncbi:MAG: site-specific integrase [Desulfofustis sp. PB-SRB1]|nr:site-specific integrase [Desulfofustis sp. PB-SRB1]